MSRLDRSGSQHATELLSLGDKGTKDRSTVISMTTRSEFGRGGL
jgi:hypothetical protein